MWPLCWLNFLPRHENSVAKEKETLQSTDPFLNRIVQRYRSCGKKGRLIERKAGGCRERGKTYTQGNPLR